MWDSAQNHQHHTGLCPVENPDFERRNVDAIESPIIPHGATTRIAAGPFTTPTTGYFSQNTNTISRKSTFSTLPEVSPSPNPSASDTVSPIATWGIPTATMPGLETVTGTLDTEKETYIGSDPTTKARTSRTFT